MPSAFQFRVIRREIHIRTFVWKNAHNLRGIVRKTSGKPRPWGHSLGYIGPDFLKMLKVTATKERPRNCHRAEERHD